jgi:multidrug efflux system membrane fusion protein
MKSRLIASSTLLFGALAVTLLGACTKVEPKPDVIRPVRTMTVIAQAGNLLTFAGEVKPRYETALAFRVPGQIIERRVEVGSVVKRGQIIAVLDATDLRLAKSAAAARLTQAQSQAALVEADFNRYAELRAKNFISQAEFDRRESQVNQSREAVSAARAEFDQIGNQVGYGELAAPHDGVIAGLQAEVGQVVSAGQTIARLARQDEREIAFSVPEHLLAAVKASPNAEIRLWSKPDSIYHGKLREISPVADPATRTYPARLSVLGSSDGAAFGMSAEVRITAKGADSIRLPLTALFHQQDQPAVWVVDGSPLAVRLTPVTTGAIHENSVEITSGLSAGQIVVTAGIHMLTEGQKVRLLDETKIADVSR